ncbi:putative MFS transporter, partial [Aureobasidium melanogenum]
MADPIAMSRDDLVPESRASSSTPAVNKTQGMDVVSPADEPRSKVQIAAILLALNLALFVAALDQTIVSTALPTIASELHSASGYTWVGSAYLLANAAAAPIWAKLSDIWGRKIILLTSVAWFFVSSIICATAPSMSVLIAGRALQGVGGGALIQVTIITISDLFSMRLRTLFIGLMEFMWALAGGIGPIVGGVFSESVSWRWCFWVNLPISGTAFFLLLFFLDVHNPRTKVVEGIMAIDFLGSLCVLGLTLMLLLGLDFGGVIFPWSSPKVICLIVFGVVMGGLFILSEKKYARYPLMPLGIFSHPSNVACLVVTFCHGFIFIAAEYFLPLYFQSVKQATPIHSGIYILPLTLCEAFMGIMSGLIIHRTGRYQELIWVGMALCTLGMGLYIYIDASTPLATILGLEVVEGLGAGMLFEPPLIAMQALVKQDDVATATATLGFIRNLATSMSIVIAGVVIQNSMASKSSALRAAGLSPKLLSEFTGGDAAANVELIKNIPDVGQRNAVKAAFAFSLQRTWILMTAVSAFGLVASFFIVRSHLSKEHTETKTGIKEKETPSTS